MMKKLFTILLVLSGLLATSCLGSDENDYVDLSPAYELYNCVYAQRVLDKDPAYVAFRLNILLTTVAEENDPDINIDNVTIFLEEDDEDGILLKKHLFADNTLTEIAPGVWQISFAEGKIGVLDYNRKGTVVIDTNEKLLNELQTGEVWVVEADEYMIIGDGSRNKYVSKFDNYYIAPENYITVEVGEEGNTQMVTRANSWDVSGNYFGYYSGWEALTANWGFKYTVTQLFDGSQSFYDISESQYEVSGEGIGIPIGQELNFEYKAGNLKYLPSCNKLWTYGGFEKVTLQSSSIDTERFPSNVVKYTWKGGTGDDRCKSSIEVGYNGYVSAVEATPIEPGKQL